MRTLLTLSAAALLAATAVPPPAAGRGLTEQELWSTRGGANGRCCGPTDRCSDFGMPADGTPPTCPGAKGCSGTWGESTGNGDTCVDGTPGDHCENVGSPEICRVKTTCSYVNGVCTPVNAGTDEAAPCHEFAPYCLIGP